MTIGIPGRKKEGSLIENAPQYGIHTHLTSHLHKPILFMYIIPFF